MGALVDRRRARSMAGALMELSVMANERHRLEQELERWHHRRAEIAERLAEITEKEARLYKFVKEPPQTQSPSKAAPSRETPSRETPSNAQVCPAAENGSRLRATEFHY